MMYNRGTSQEKMPKRNEISKEQIAQSNALAAIAEAYYHGIGVPVNYDEAFRYYKKAAEMGNADALGQVGLCYELGRGTDRNLSSALDSYENASEMGSAFGTMKIGDFYSRGVKNLVAKDTQRASEYYVQALIMMERNQESYYRGDIYLRLADCLEKGNGVKRDIQNAYNLYTMAADAFYDRVVNGAESECEPELEKAERGEAHCARLLHLKPEKRSDGFEA